MFSTAKLALHFRSYSDSAKERNRKAPSNAAKEEKANKRPDKVAIDVDAIAEHVRTSENPSMKRFYDAIPERFSDARQTHALLDAAGFLCTEARALHTPDESQSAPTVTTPTPTRRSSSF